MLPVSTDNTVKLIVMGDWDGLHNKIQNNVIKHFI